jgi:hypothetical protein
VDDEVDVVVAELIQGVIHLEKTFRETEMETRGRRRGDIRL